MKTILVCTDYSPAARSAASYAVALADCLKARIVLLHAFLPEPAIVTDPAVITSEEDLRKLNEHQLMHEVTRLHAPAALQLSTVSWQGDAVDAIMNVARTWNADLIIMGMKASGKNIRKVLGSTVTSVVRISNVPVLIVPENTPFEKPTAVALAWESDAAADTNPALLEELRTIGDVFDAAVYLVHVSKNVYKAAYAVLNRPFRLQRLLWPLETELKNLHGKDLAKVLTDFVQENDVKMLVMLPRKHSLLERLFMASNTRHLIFEATVPILVLPGIKKGDY